MGKFFKVADEKSFNQLKELIQYNDKKNVCKNKQLKQYNKFKDKLTKDEKQGILESTLDEIAFDNWNIVGDALHKTAATFT